MAKSEKHTRDGSSCVEAAVLGFPNIVKHIFDFLPAKALCTTSRVCKIWQHQAETVLRQRRPYCWELFEVSADTDSTAVLNSVERYILDLPVRPLLIMVFSTDKLYKLKRRRKNILGDILAHTVPTRCKIICSSTYGIIGTPSNLTNTKEIESSDAITLLCFGHHPGLEFTPFVLNTELFRKRMEALDQNNRDKELAMQITDFVFPPPSPDMKAILMCCNEICDPKIGQMLYTYYLKQLLIAGGFVNNLSMNTSSDTCDYAELGDKYLSCLGIRGERVHVASVMFPPYLSTKEDADTVVQSLKDKTKHFPLNHAIAFMFACVARGMQCYGSYNVESSAFRKHFPTIPVFGFFGNGEIGFEFPRQEMSEKGPDLFHSYTTFIVLLALP